MSQKSKIITVHTLMYENERKITIRNHFQRSDHNENLICRIQLVCTVNRIKIQSPNKKNWGRKKEQRKISH